MQVVAGKVVGGACGVQRLTLPVCLSSPSKSFIIVRMGEGERS